MDRLAIIGSGDLGQLIAYHAKEDNHYDVAGYFDDYKAINERIGTLPVLGKISDIFQAYRSGLFDCVIVAIGYKHFSFRKKIFDEIKNKIPFAKIVHSSAYVARSCTIGDGVVILPGCSLDNNVVIEDNVFLNLAATIAHDSHVKAHTFISPRAAVAGFVTIGECCNIGINSTIIDNLIIGDYIQTGGGAVVIDSIYAPGIYAGVPARILKRTHE